MKNKSFVVWALVVIAIIVGAVVFVGKKSPPPEVAQPVAVTSGSFVMTPAFRPENHSWGNQEAKVVLVEFYDPQCEACRAVHPMMKKLTQDYGGKVRFVHRYMPFHDLSVYASSALEEARELGKYEQALDLLFETQDEWGGHGNASAEKLVAVLQKAGLPKDKLTEAYLVGKHGEKISRDRDDGRALGVNATPTFLVNGRALDQINEAAIRASLDQSLSNQ